MPASLLKSSVLVCAAAADQVQHSHYERNDQKDMDQATGYMKSPTEQPHDEQDRENSPKHEGPLAEQCGTQPMGIESGRSNAELSHRIIVLARAASPTPDEI